MVVACSRSSPTPGCASSKPPLPLHVESVRQAFIDVISDEALQTIGTAFEAVAETLETGEPDPIMSARSNPDAR